MCVSCVRRGAFDKRQGYPLSFSEKQQQGVCVSCVRRGAFGNARDNPEASTFSRGNP